MLTAGSRRSSGRALNIVRLATANARRSNVLRRCRGTVSWWRAADRRCRRVATWATGMQQSDRYTGALPSRHRWASMPSPCCILFRPTSVVLLLLHDPWYQFPRDLDVTTDNFKRFLFEKFLFAAYSAISALDAFYKFTFYLLTYLLFISTDNSLHPPARSLPFLYTTCPGGV